MKSEGKAWVCAIIIGILWANALAIFITAYYFGYAWSSLTIYLATLSVGFGIFFGIAMVVAIIGYGETSDEKK